MSSFDSKKNIEDSIKDGLIITAKTTGIFFTLKAANVKLRKPSLDAINIMNLAGGIRVGVLCLIQENIMESTRNGSTSERQQQNFVALRGYKIAIYFAMVKILLGSLTAKWGTASSRLNT